jgi:hypothetical protein
MLSRFGAIVNNGSIYSQPDLSRFEKGSGDSSVSDLEEKRGLKSAIAGGADIIEGLGDILSGVAGTLKGGSGGSSKGTASASNTNKLSSTLPGTAAQQFAATMRGPDDRATQGPGAANAIATVNQSPQIAQAELSQNAAQSANDATEALRDAEQQQAQTDPNPIDIDKLFANVIEPPPPPPEEEENLFGAEAEIS